MCCCLHEFNGAMMAQVQLLLRLGIRLEPDGGVGPGSPRGFGVDFDFDSVFVLRLKIQHLARLKPGFSTGSCSGLCLRLYAGIAFSTYPVSLSGLDPSPSVRL